MFQQKEAKNMTKIDRSADYARMLAARQALAEAFEHGVRKRAACISSVLDQLQLEQWMDSLVEDAC